MAGRIVNLIYNIYSKNYIIANSNNIDKNREELGCDLGKAVLRLKEICGRKRKIEIIMENVLKEDRRKVADRFENYGNVNISSKK